MMYRSGLKTTLKVVPESNRAIEMRFVCKTFKNFGFHFLSNMLCKVKLNRVQMESVKRSGVDDF